jgi:hypothetical protein
MKKVLGFFVISALGCLVLSGCQGGGSEPEGPPPGPPTSPEVIPETPAGDAGSPAREGSKGGGGERTSR